MNVLIFVVIILMSMSILTYAKIETFLNLSTMRRQYICYMTTTEREAANAVQLKKYESQHGVGTDEEFVKDIG